MQKKDYDTRENAILYGANFESSFNYALEVDRNSYSYRLE